jgi:hypothetical protein
VFKKYNRRRNIVKRKIITTVVAMMLFNIMVGSGTVSAAALVETDDSFRGQPVGLEYTFIAPVDLGSNTYSGSIGDVDQNRDRTDHLRFNLPAGSTITAGFYQTTGGPKGISFWSDYDGQPNRVVYQGGTYSFNATELAAINGYGFLDVQPFDFEGGVPGNKNTYTIGLTVRYLTVPVTIDIKPGSDPNSFNNDGNGVISVAILTTDSFDAATVDPFSVSLDGAGVHVKGKSGNAGALEDVDNDGDLDLVVQIMDVDGIYQAGDTLATLTGVTFDGHDIVGEDTIRIVP